MGDKKKVLASLEQISEYFELDKDSKSGLSRKKSVMKSGRRGQQGEVAGFINQRGYWVVKIRQHAYQVHRLVYALANQIELSNMEGLVIDHLNGDFSDNRIENLRLTTQTFNGRNSLNVPTKTGIVGVTIQENQRGNKYAMASWQSLDGKRKVKYFSFMKYGEDLAVKLATEVRKSEIEKLQLAGAGYTERHIYQQKEK